MTTTLAEETIMTALPEHTDTIALVTDATPAYLDYADYRGWVALSATGEWIADLTDEQAADAIPTMRPIVLREYVEAYEIPGSTNPAI